MNRREFWQRATAAGAGASLPTSTRAQQQHATEPRPRRPDRERWTAIMRRVADPVLSLSPSDPFWSAPPQPWTAAKAWSGQPFPIDHALA